MGSVLSQCTPEMSTLHYVLQGQFPPSQECIPQLCYRERCILPKPQSLSSKSCLQKKTGTLRTSPSPVRGPDRFISCANSMLHYLNLSLSLLSLQGKGSLPRPLCHHFSLPQFTSTHLTFAKLSPSNCRDPIATSHIDVLGVPSDLTTLQLRLRDEESPWSPLLLCHRNSSH